MSKKIKQYNKGFFRVPHLLLTLAENREINRSEYILLNILMHYNNIFQAEDKGWFYCTDESIIKSGLISKGILSEVKISLEDKGYIKIKKGYSHCASEYMIMFEIDEEGNILSV